MNLKQSLDMARNQMRGTPIQVVKGKKIEGTVTACMEPTCNSHLYIAFDPPFPAEAENIQEAFAMDRKRDELAATGLSNQHWCFIHADHGWYCALCMKT